MSSDVLTNVLSRRRDRVIATILGVKEREIDPLLVQLNGKGNEASAKLRRVILDQIHDMHQLYLDVVTSLDADDGVVLNELWLDKIDEIHDAVVRARARHGSEP